MDSSATFASNSTASTDSTTPAVCASNARKRTAPGWLQQKESQQRRRGTPKRKEAGFWQPYDHYPRVNMHKCGGLSRGGGGDENDHANVEHEFKNSDGHEHDDTGWLTDAARHGISSEIEPNEPGESLEPLEDLTDANDTR